MSEGVHQTHIGARMVVKTKHSSNGINISLMSADNDQYEITVELFITIFIPDKNILLNAFYEGKR